MGQVGQFCCRKLVDRMVGVDGSQMADFLRHNGADPCKMVIQGLLDCHGRALYGLAEGFLRYAQRILLGHCLRDEIHSSGKDFADGTHICGYVLDAVNNCAVLFAENDIAVLSHDLHDEPFSAEIAHFIQML